MLLSRLGSGLPEVFASIQGEGPTCGLPSVFVRLASCNLRCEWCFAPDTPVLLGDWSWRPLERIRVGDEIVALRRPGPKDTHQKLTRSIVTHISVRDASTVSVNGDLHCTSDHKFYLTGRDRDGRLAVRKGWREIHRVQGLRTLFVAETVDRNPELFPSGWLSGIADGQAGYRLRPRRHSLRSSYGQKGEMDCLQLTVDADGSFSRGILTSRVIESVVPTGKIEPVITLTTTAGSFVAGGFIVKNCDTRYTWDWKRYDPRGETITLDGNEVARLVQECSGGRIDNVVLTGGEPMLQRRELVSLAERLATEGFRIEVETNGTIMPPDALARRVTQWNVSPKLSSSGNSRSEREVPEALAWYARRSNAFWKFVLLHPEDVREVDSMVTRYGVPAERVILMPEGIDSDTLAKRSRWLAPLCEERGFRLGTRLHVLLWGAERGR